MTVQQLRDIIIVRYMKESKKRKLPEDEIGDGEFQLYYDMVLNEIMNELRLFQLTQDIALTPVTVFTEYALSNTFGGLVNYEMVATAGGNWIHPELVDISELPTAGDLTAGSPNRIAFYLKNDGLHYAYLYPLVSVAGTLRVRYRNISEINEGIGAGDGTDLSKTVPLPFNYTQLLIVGVLSYLIPDFVDEFQARLQNAKYLTSTPTKGKTTYSLGGYDEDGIDNGFSKNFNGE